jgi:hypothetical protein
MNFQQHINKETATINNFFTTKEDITLNKIVNEGYSSYDAVITSANTKEVLYACVEAKTRGVNSTTYEGGAILELYKFNSLINILTSKRNLPENQNKTLKCFYLMQFNDKTFLFDLESVNLGNLKIIQLPKHSATDGSKEWINKPVFFLDYKDAILVSNTR